MNKNTIFIGLTGRARSGKDTFAEIFINESKKEGKTVKVLSLANALKKDVEDFLRDKCGYNVWSQVTEEKNKYREHHIKVRVTLSVH